MCILVQTLTSRLISLRASRSAPHDSHLAPAASDALLQIFWAPTLSLASCCSLKAHGLALALRLRNHRCLIGLQRSTSRDCPADCFRGLILWNTPATITLCQPWLACAHCLTLPAANSPAVARTCIGWKFELAKLHLQAPLHQCFPPWNEVEGLLCSGSRPLTPTCTVLQLANVPWPSQTRRNDRIAADRVNIDRATNEYL